MTWGRILANYNPANSQLQSWPLPSFSGVTLQPEDPALDGNAVSLEVAQNGEVWVAANSVRAIFGFNSINASWDRTIPLPLTPTLLTRLASPASGQLTVNGVDHGATPVMALINTASGAAVELTSRVRAYVLSGSDGAVYADDNRSLGKVVLSQNQVTPLAPSLPIAGDPELAIDSSANIYFSLAAYKSIGVGKISSTSGEMTAYPFPQSPNKSSTVAIACPRLPCNNSSSVLDPEIQSIEVDGKNNVWVITAVPGAGFDPRISTTAAPLYELPAGS